MCARRSLLVCLTLVCACVAGALGGASAAFAEGNVQGSCPNAEERFGASANLPDCRAYELVTPQIKEDDSFLSGTFGFPDGNHVYLKSFLALPGATIGLPETALSTRTASGWVTTPLTPPPGPVSPYFEDEEATAAVERSVAFTSNFSAAFVDWLYQSSPLDQNDGLNVYRVDIPSQESTIESLPQSGPSTESLIDVPGVGPSENASESYTPGTYLAGVSGDGSRVFFETNAKFPVQPGTPVNTSGPSSAELYERHGGNTTLVGVMPDGSVPSCGSEIASGSGSPTDPDSRIWVYGAVASDGSNVVFSTPGFEGNELYGGSCGGTAPGVYLREDYGTRTVRLPGSAFVGRSRNENVIFTDDTAHIYEYNIETGKTTTIAATGNYPRLVADSADGSRVYYETEGENENEVSVYEDGVTKLVGEDVGGGFAAPIGGDQDGRDGRQENLGYTTPDGSEFAFVSAANLTSYDTGGHREVYLYDANTESVACVSCNPDGAPAVGNAGFLQTKSLTDEQEPEDPFIPPTYDVISNDGSQVFFETTEALVPQDTNGLMDVYEWEDGHIYLLSSGQGAYGSYIQGASENGDDVFIQTADHLLPQDIENSVQIYDARVDGGFPYTPPVYGCDSGECQGPQTPAPVFAAPPSATFVGVGNPVGEPESGSAGVKAKPKAKHKQANKKKRKKKARARGSRREHRGQLRVRRAARARHAGGAGRSGGGR